MKGNADTIIKRFDGMADLSCEEKINTTVWVEKRLKFGLEDK